MTDEKPFLYCGNAPELAVPGLGQSRCPVTDLVFPVVTEEWLDAYEPGESLWTFSWVMYDMNYEETGIVVTRAEVDFYFQVAVRTAFGKDLRNEAISKHLDPKKVSSLVSADVTI